MEERETVIRVKAEEVVNSTLSFPKRVIFNWVLFHARRGVKHRENMTFARTKMFGLFRYLFRAIGSNLVSLGLLKDKQVSYCACARRYVLYVAGGRTWLFEILKYKILSMQSLLLLQ